MYEFISAVLFVVVASMISYYLVRKNLSPWNGSAMLVVGNSVEEKTLIPIPFGKSGFNVRKDIIIQGLFFPGVDAGFIPKVLFRETNRTQNLNKGPFHYSIQDGDGGLYLMVREPIDHCHISINLERWINNKRETFLIVW